MDVPRKRICPRTTEEAQILLDEAIQNDDFASAEEFARDRDDLALVREELDLGQVVSGYQERRNMLSERLAGDYAFLERIAHCSIEAVKDDYEDQFQRKRREQRAELEGLFSEWRAARGGIRVSAEIDFEQSLKAVQTVARDRRLKEAAKLRDAALRARTMNRAKPNTAVDAHFERRAAMIIERHRAELDILIRDRKRAIESLITTKDEAQAQAAQACELDNGAEIVSIRRGLKPGARMPLSLTMQAVRPPSHRTIGRGDITVPLSD
jgi:hypothetical protein